MYIPILEVRGSSNMLRDGFGASRTRKKGVTHGGLSGLYSSQFQYVRMLH